MKNILKFASVAVMLGTIVEPALAQAPPAENIRGYTAVGRIKWNLPASPELTFGVPHWTMGPRLLCKGQLRHCEISVAARDITIDLTKRRADLYAELEQWVSRSKEKSLQIRSFGTAPEVIYATLTDSRPAPGEFIILTQGFSVNGTAVIKFVLQSNDPKDVPKILEVVQSARTMDALPMWAWKLSDYKSVCAERFAELKAANDAAFKSSPFAAVDYVGFWKIDGKTREEIAASLEEKRKGYAEHFDTKPPAERLAFCRNFPQWVTAAAKDLPAK